MSSNHDRHDLPDELRNLGEMQRIFESTQKSLVGSLTRGLFPILTAGIMVLIGEIWLVPRTWKYYLLVGIAGLMFLNGLRVVFQTLRRRNQKVALFEQGFAVWRNDILTTCRWDHVDLVDANYSRNNNGSLTLLSFKVLGKSNDDQHLAFRFDPAGDAIKNLHELCQEMEDRTSQARVPTALAELDQGRELFFGKQVWGKYVSEKIGVSLRGVHQQYRSGTAVFLDWCEIESVHASQGHLNIAEKDGVKNWLRISSDDFPGYMTLVAAAEHAFAHHKSQMALLRLERLPAALTGLDEGGELRIGPFAVTTHTLRYQGELLDWESVLSLELGFDHIAAEVERGIKLEELSLSLDELSLPDRLLLWTGLKHAQERYDESTEPKDNLAVAQSTGGPLP